MAVVTVNESVTAGTAGLKLGAFAVQRFLRGGSMTSTERTAALALMGDGVDLITYHWSGGYSNATPGTQQLGTSDFAPTSMATARDYATHGSKIGLDAAFANLDALIALRPGAKVAIVMFDHPQAMLNGATRTTGSNFPWPASTYWGGSYAGTLCDQLITRYGSKILAFSYGQELKGLTNRTDTTQLDSFAAGYTAWATYMRAHHPTVELWYPHLNYFATASLASRQAAVDALIAGGSTLQAADETIINRLMDDVSPTLVDRMTYDVSIVDYNSADTWRNSYAAVASRTTLEYHLQRVLKAKMTSRWSSVKPLVAIESYFNVNQTLEVLDSGSPITPNQQAALATAILIAAQKGGVTYHNRWEPQGGDPGAEAPDGNIASWWDRDGVATPAWYQARDLITAIPVGSTLYTVSSDNANLAVASGGDNVFILNTSGSAISASVTATSGSLTATSIPAYGYAVRKLPSGSGVPPTPVTPPADPPPTTTPITYPKNRHHNRMWHIGLVPTDQLGSGTADETTVLYGDNTWGPPPFDTPANTYGTPAAGSATTGIRTDAVLPGPPLVILTLTNKSGGSVAAGDVVVIDTANDTAFTTTTTGQAEVSVGIAQATIANNASGAVLVQGYASLVNVPSSMTRGHYVETHTVAKQAVGNSSRRAGSFGQFLTGGTTPSAILWGQTDQTAAGGSSFATPAIALGTAAAAGAASTVIRSDATIAAFDATVPVTQAFSDAAATGSAAFAARRDHVHGMPASPGGGGALVLLEQHTASSSATLDFTTAISSTYDTYLIEFVSVLPATNGAIPCIRFGTGGGPTWDSGSNYGWQVVNSQWGGSSVGAAGLISDTQIQIFNAGQSSSFPLSVSAWLWDPGNSSFRKYMAGVGPVVFNVGPATYHASFQGGYNLATAVTAVRFLYSTGNIASGTVRMYGLTK